MSPDIDWTRIIMLVAPIIIIQIGLQIYALVDLARAIKVRGPKWLWAVIIIFGEILGPIAYFAIAKREA